MNPLWDVVQLRERGVRLPKQTVAALIPTRGHLQLHPRRPGWHPSQSNPPLLAGLVAPGSSTWAVPPLDGARVKLIRAEHMLIAGTEEFDLGRGRIERHPQTWWCRLVALDGVRDTPRHLASDDLYANEEWEAQLDMPVLG